jgi:mannose-1-phosphate guanylyltransferase/mannose-6-phosphate isomerase
MPTIRPLILSGGSGTRLWPLSTPERPKQFAALLGGRSLFELTLGRLADSAPPIIVAGAGHASLVEEACASAGVTPQHLILEPSGRNTAPASVAGAIVADPDDVLAILPSDHLITELEPFRRAVAAAMGHAEDGRIVVFGVTPDRPETGYGYIETGEPVAGGWVVSAFTEKPSRENAQRMLEEGGRMWNSGMFVLAAATLLAEAERLVPRLMEKVAEAMGDRSRARIELGPRFEELEAISFDHAVMEKTDRAVVLPLEAGWHDIGSYHSLWEASARDGDDNAVEGDVVLSEVTGSLVKATSRRVAVLGVEDMVVVETRDAVLVVPRGRSQAVRDLAGG